MKIKKRIIIFLIIIIAAGVIMTMLFCVSNKYKDLCAYTEKLLKIEWDDCIESATGDLETRGEELAHIKLEVKDGYEEKVLGILQNRFGQSYDLGDSWPGWGGHPYAAEIENGDTRYIFMTLMAGKRATTRTVIIYVVYDEKEQMYIYVMG